jgi:membrane protein implicated in regulation of membrane protease activity
MTVADLYLVCFIIGFLLSALSFLFGSLHLHLPHFHIGHAHVHVAHAGHAGHDASTGQLPIINFGTITAFLAWFGGIGYLLTRYSTFVATIALLLAIFGGMVGASIVFFLVSRVLMKNDRPLNPADYDMVGVLGKVAVPIRENGTGEIIYSQAGTRRTCGARAEDGVSVAKGTEIIVTRYERGIAYVRPWTEMAGDDSYMAIEAGESNPAGKDSR